MSMEWQPIETAPKDGTHILLYSRKWGVFAGRIPSNMAHYKRPAAFPLHSNGGSIEVQLWMHLPDSPK